MSNGEQRLTQGSIIITATNAATVLIAYALNVFLARNLGPDLFGLFGVVITVLTWLELIVAEGLPLWVARNAESADWRRSLPWPYLIAQLLLSLSLVAVMFLSAPLLAHVFKAPHAVGLFRVASIDIPLFAFYTLFASVLLGARLYGAYSTTTATYYTSKLAFTYGLVAIASLSIVGAILGSISASVIGLVAAMLLLLVHAAREKRRSTAPEPAYEGPTGYPGASDVVKGSATPATLVLLQTLMLSMGLWLVRALLPVSDAGYYRAASLVAQVPITIAAGFTWALYAAYSAAYRRGELAKCRHYLSQATRLLLVGGIMWAAIIGPTARPLMTLLFGVRYQQSAGVLTALSVALIAGNFALVIAPTLIVEGRGALLLSAAAALLVLEIALTFFLAPMIGTLGAAVATGGALAAGGVGILGLISHDLDFRFWPALLRTLLPGLVVAAIASLLPVQRPLYLIGWYPLLAALFLALLFLARAITRDDFEAIREGMK